MKQLYRTKENKPFAADVGTAALLTLSCEGGPGTSLGAHKTGRAPFTAKASGLKWLLYVVVNPVHGLGDGLLPHPHLAVLLGLLHGRFPPLVFGPVR